MLILMILVNSIISYNSVSIVQPVDNETYDGNWLPLRAIVENDNIIPDSVNYILNGQAIAQIPKLNTDWPTYMQNDLHHGFSESPAPTDNTILWTAPVTGELHEFPTPVIVDGIVYYPSDYGNDSLYALDAATGELIWKYCVGMTDDAVTVKDGRLYTASDSIWCLDALTGERIWANGDTDYTGSTPAVVDGRVYCGKAEIYPGRISWVYCFDALTGTQIWADTLSGAMVSCMTVWNDMVFVPTYYYVQDTPLYALDANTGSIIWENTDSWQGYWDSSPVIVDGVIYIGGYDGAVRAIDAITGATIWEIKITNGGINDFMSSTPAYHDGILYFGDQVDTYHCLNAATGTTIWSVPGLQHGSSGIADGMVFYGETFNQENARVFALDCDTGEEIWSYRTFGSYIQGSPAITDGIVYIAGTDWNLYAFGTGLKYTYLDDLYAQVGSNELIVTSFDDGAVAADTINFTVTQTGISFEPTRQLALHSTPNPITASGSIFFTLDEAGMVSLSVFDLTGRAVTSLLKREMVQGEHTVLWNGCSEAGQTVSSGLYLCRIEHEGVVETIGLCLLK